MPVPIFWRRATKCMAVVAWTVLLISCGGGEDDPLSPGGSGSDFVTMAVDGGNEGTYAEASGLPSIDCDPRVDWGFSQVILWNDHTNGSGPNGYELFFEIMFPNVDDVGTYTVHGDMLQALFYDGINYSASPLMDTSNGSVTVTRSDTRIEGTYTLTVVDAQGNTKTLAGSFSVENGFSLSCP